MENELFYYLQSTPEYKEFKKKSRIRSIAALIILSVFWTIIISTTSFNSIDEVSVLYIIILMFASILVLKYAYGAFLKHPKVVAQGTIVDIREKKRTVNEEEKIQTRVSYEYLINCGTNEYWGECIHDYIEGHSQKHNIGEQVIFFSMSAGNNYIIKKRGV